MFRWWGGVVARRRWWVLGATLVLVIVGGVWGTGVFNTLASGGFDDPASESDRANARITAVFGEQGNDMEVLYTATSATVDQAAFADPVKAVLAQLKQRPEIVNLTSWYLTQDPSLVSTDRHETYVGIRFTPGDTDVKTADVKALRDLVVADSGQVQTTVGGLYGFNDDANKQIEKDIVRAETISLPILLVLLLLIFRGVVAAVTPLVVGIVAILGALAVTRVISEFTEVSVFASNVITMLGLGMAIDYALFIVSRFREELAAGETTAEAIRHTIATAGRTVIVSGLTVALALSSLLLFPQGFLKSMAYGGMAAVLVAMLAALTALPAFLAVLGPRINAASLRRRRATPSGRGWAWLAGVVMRRPVVFLVVIAVGLIGLGTPFLRASFGSFDERVLPVGTPSRTVAEAIKADFPGGSVDPILAVVEGPSGPFVAAVKALPGVSGVTVAATQGSTSLVSVGYTAESTSDQARELVTAIRDLPAARDGAVLVTGRPAANLDQIDSLTSRLWIMAVYAAVVTFVLLFLAFGSLVLPLKAIVMNAISIGASFGVVVWIFQDGHGSGWLGFTPTGSLEPTNLVLMLAILFGLSTDYEVFLLSRVREEWDLRGDNTAAVTAGLQRTGGIITAAALLLIIVVAGFATGGSTTIKMLGVGTVVAVFVDAVFVRTLLVPATMRLLGRFNWWAPGPLARLYRRYGLRESATPVPEPAR